VIAAPLNGRRSKSPAEPAFATCATPEELERTSDAHFSCVFIVERPFTADA